MAKTNATPASVTEYLAAIDDAARRTDCEVLCQLMANITGQNATMWGAAIVGFGSYHYRYESGHEGDSCVIGFSSRKSAISIYLTASSDEQDALLARLGKHKMAKACLSIKKLSDVDLQVLQQLLRASFEERNRRDA